jgi:4-amino-4-deoxy-L-arabinose transferase-like glycosyltransferase
MSAEGRKEQSCAAAGEPGGRVIAAAFIAFVAVWSAYFAISEAATAIHNDMAEAYVWGQEFQLGYNQHPPFFAWIAGLWFLVLPRAGWTFAILSTINAGIGLVGAWRLIGRFAGGATRAAATALLLLTPFYTFLAYKYNANSIFLSLWPWTLYFFVRSLDQRKLGDAALFGLFVGLALLSKYYALILVATCFLGALQHPERRRWFAGPSPWLAAAIAALVVAPHLWWLATHGAPPLRYLARVSGRGYGATARYAATAFFGALAQNAIAVAAALFVAGLGPAALAANLRVQWQAPRFRMIAILTVAPLLLTVAAALVLRNKVSTNMLIGTFPLAPLLAVEATGARNVERLASLSLKLAAALSLAALVASPAVAVARAWISHDQNDVEPRQELAVAADLFWREATGKPLAYVGGTRFYDNGVAFYSADRPHGFVGFDAFRNQWVTLEKLAAGGLLSVCVKDDVGCLAAAAPFRTADSRSVEITLAHAAFGHKAKAVAFVLTAIPPR